MASGVQAPMEIVLKNGEEREGDTETDTSNQYLRPLEQPLENMAEDPQLTSELYVAT